MELFDYGRFRNPAQVDQAAFDLWRRELVLAHLERSIFRYPSAACPVPVDGRLRLYETDTPEEEVRQICIAIRKLVLTKGCQYRDISVVCGDLENYGKLFEKLAPRYEIPFYVDRTSSAGLSPLTGEPSFY